MPESPDQEWRRLTAHYAQMWDDELLNLAAGYNDLTDMAKQVLRDEMRKRNLADPAAPPQPPKPGRPSALGPSWAPVGLAFDDDLQILRRRYAGMLDRDLLHEATGYNQIPPAGQQALCEEMRRRDLGDPISLAADYDYTHPESLARTEAEVNARLESRRALHGEEERDYTWMTPLCDCVSRREAMQRLAMLSRARIQWQFFDPDRGRSDPTTARLDYRILVPADELEEALAIIAQPIPQDIIDESKMETPEFEMPRCPRCHSEEPTLVGTEPSNQWHCESCGNEWADPIPEPKEA
jgi:hypothetical protein